MCNDQGSFFVLERPSPPPEYTAILTRTRPPSYTDSPPPRYSDEPPPRYSDTPPPRYSDICVYASSRVSCEQVREQSRYTGISTISHPERNSDITRTHDAYTGSFPIDHEYTGCFRPEVRIPPRSTDASLLTGSLKNNLTPHRHGTPKDPQTARQAYLEQRRSQSRNTAIRLTPRVSPFLRTKCCSYLICMAFCSFLWFPFTGIFVVYFLYRDHKFMSGSRYNTSPNERNKTRTSAKIAFALIVLSAVLFLVWFYALACTQLDFKSRDSFFFIFFLFSPIIFVIISCFCGYWCEACNNKLLSRYTCPGVLLDRLRLNCFVSDATV